MAAAQTNEAGPSSCPTNRLYVPSSVRSQVLQWGHSSQLSGHPGSRRTQAFVSRRFWWSSMKEDISDFVQACAVCAQNKTSTRPPAGLLQPLSVPKRSWSHISHVFFLSQVCPHQIVTPQSSSFPYLISLLPKKQPI